MELEFVQRWDDARLAFGNGANLSPTVRDYLNAMHHYKVHEMQNFLVMLFITHLFRLHNLNHFENNN